MLQFLQRLTGGLQSPSVKTETVVFSLLIYTGLLLFGRNIFISQQLFSYLIVHKNNRKLIYSWNCVTMDECDLWHNDQMPQSPTHDWTAPN